MTLGAQLLLYLFQVVCWVVEQQWTVSICSCRCAAQCAFRFSTSVACCWQGKDDPERLKHNPHPKWDVPVELIEWQPAYAQKGGLVGGSLQATNSLPPGQHSVHSSPVGWAPYPRSTAHHACPVSETGLGSPAPWQGGTLAVRQARGGACQESGKAVPRPSGLHITAAPLLRRTARPPTA